MGSWDGSKMVAFSILFVCFRVVMLIDELREGFHLHSFYRILLQLDGIRHLYERGGIRITLTFVGSVRAYLTDK